MEIEVKPVTIERRIEFLKQIEVNKELTKKPFPWIYLLIGGVIGTGIYLSIIYLHRKKEKQKALAIEQYSTK